MFYFILEVFLHLIEVISLPNISHVPHFWISLLIFHYGRRFLLFLLAAVHRVWSSRHGWDISEALSGMRNNDIQWSVFFLFSCSLTCSLSSCSLWCFWSGTGAFPTSTATGSKAGINSWINGYRYQPRVDDLAEYPKCTVAVNFYVTDLKWWVSAVLVCFLFVCLVDWLFFLRLRRLNTRSCKQSGSTFVHASPTYPASSYLTLV